MTPSQTRVFQACHRAPCGAPLKVDGQEGPMTRWAASATAQPWERQQVLARAQVRSGLQEVGANRSPDGAVAAWLIGAGISTPAPYCAAATSAWLGLEPGEPGAQRLGKRFQVVDSPGFCDVGWYPTGSWQGHVFLIIGGDQDYVLTFEANAQNRVGVFRRARCAVSFACPYNTPLGVDLPPCVHSQKYPLLDTQSVTR